MADRLNHANLFNNEFDLGGGSNVVANPAEEATDTLVKLKVEDVVYSVEGGGDTTPNLISGVLTTITVETADWVLESPATYENYPYRADLTAVGVTSDISPDVRYNYSEIESGIFAPIADCGTDKVMIYASAVPNGDFTIPVIILNVTRGGAIPGTGSIEGLTYSNITVHTTDWINEGSGGATPTYSSYPFRADISLQDVTADYSPDIIYTLTQINMGVLSPIAVCGSGVLNLYASAIPDSDFTIPKIVCTKVQ